MFVCFVCVDSVSYFLSYPDVKTENGNSCMYRYFGVTSRSSVCAVSCFVVLCYGLAFVFLCLFSCFVLFLAGGGVSRFGRFALCHGGRGCSAQDDSAGACFSQGCYRYAVDRG